MRIYGDYGSGNCLKVKYTADHLGLPYDWIDVDIMKGGARTAEFAAMNPAMQLRQARPSLHGLKAFGSGHPIRM